MNLLEERLRRNRMTQEILRQRACVTLRPKAQKAYPRSALCASKRVLASASVGFACRVCSAECASMCRCGSRSRARATRSKIPDTGRSHGAGRDQTEHTRYFDLRLRLKPAATSAVWTDEQPQSEAHQTHAGREGQHHPVCCHVRLPLVAIRSHHFWHPAPKCIRMCRRGSCGNYVWGPGLDCNANSVTTS